MIKKRSSHDCMIARRGDCPIASKWALVPPGEAGRKRPGLRDDRVIAGVLIVGRMFGVLRRDDRGARVIDSPKIDIFDCQANATKSRNKSARSRSLRRK